MFFLNLIFKNKNSKDFQQFVLFINVKKYYNKIFHIIYFEMKKIDYVNRKLSAKASHSNKLIFECVSDVLSIPSKDVTQKIYEYIKIQL